MAEPQLSQQVRGPDAVILGRNAKAVDNRAESMAARLHRLLLRYARLQARLMVAEIERSAIVTTVFKSDSLVLKAEDERRVAEQMRRLLVTEGAAAFKLSVGRTIGKGRAVITDQRMSEFVRAKEIRLQQIMSTTNRDVRNSVRQIILTALSEVPRPSTGEIARRINQTFHGNPGGRPERTIMVDGVPVPVEVDAPLIDSRVLPTTRVRLDNGGNLYSFSPERAALIARTEMAQAENEGIVEGYVQTGVEGLRWLAYRDGRSGKREHDEMHRKTVRIGEKFELPDGTRMRYPGDSTAPIRHLANCRCTVAPVLIM